MLTGKQRSYLRNQGNKLTPIIHIGKEGISRSLLLQVDEALTCHELIKGRCLKNSLEDVKDIANMLVKECNADIVQIIGNNFIIFRRNEKKPVYHLPG